MSANNSEGECVCELFGVPPLPPAPGSDEGSPTSIDAKYLSMDSYEMPFVPTNCHDPAGRQYFNMGYWLQMSFRHELASRCFLACLHYNPNCAMAHALVALGT
jgi:hypothetical protein